MQHDGSTAWERWLGRLAAALVLAAALASLLLTVHGVWGSWAALPSGDILAYAAELVRAADGSPRWGWLWERHNGVHFVPLPKFAYWLDVWLVGGRGTLVVLLACAAQSLVALLWVRALWRQPQLMRREKVLLAAVAVLLCTSIVQAESLLNPVNLQWALLALGTTLLALGLQGLSQPRRCMQFAAGIVLSLGSGAPWLVLVTALLLVLPYARGQQAQAVRGLLVAALLLGLLWLEELLRVYAFGSSNLLLLWLYRPVLDEAAWQQAAAWFAQDPRLHYTQWWLVQLGFMARFLTPPVNALWPSWLYAPLALALLWPLLRGLGRAPVAHDLRAALLYPLLFVLGLGVAAGVLRAFLPAAYTFRFANMGLLFVFAALLLAYLQVSPRRRLWLSLLLVLPYALGTLPVAYKEAGKAVVMGDRTQLSQVAYAVGSDAMAAIVQDPGFYWQATDAAILRAQRGALRDAAIGVYATPGYRVFRGAQALPARRVACRYTLQSVTPHDGDARAWRAIGLAEGADGRVFTQVLLEAAPGVPVGFGVPWQSSGRVFTQWREPRTWGAHWKSAQPLARLRLTAWDGDTACEPAWVDLAAP